MFAKFTGKQLRRSLFLNKVYRPEAYNFIKKETLAQVFSCEFAKFQGTPFFNTTHPVVASEKRDSSRDVLL